jgi:Tol biopolymer transport system component/DNA-binding winged helix-turn-helix (wHTH) protein
VGLANYGSLRRARFDCFQVDLSSNELFRAGVRVPVQDKPLQVLRLLLEAEGRVVTREQLQSALWADHTFVDFEHGVNTAVKKLRHALEDSAEHPSFVETLPRIGYRFIAPVEWAAEAEGKSALSHTATSPLPDLNVVPQYATGDEASRSHWRWPFLVRTLGLLVLIALGGYLLWLRTPTRPQNLTIAPFTTFPGFEIAPSFSPDGNQIVFSWTGHEKGMGFDLYIKQVGQEQTVQLTHHRATFLASAWSPDGQFIAFMRQAEPDASGIYVITPLGGTERKVAAITQYLNYDPIGLSWSPDSKWVAFAKADSPDKNPDPGTEHYRIHVVNIETSEDHILPAPSPECVHAWQPAFSPDGKYLAAACVLNWAGVGKIYVQTPDGKQAREVAGARSSGGFAGIDWTVDSKSLIYSADQHLWRINLAGAKPEKLLFAPDAESLSVARTRDRLAYGQVRHPGSIWQIEMANHFKPNGPATKLISSSRGDMGQRISPDGKHIVFQSWRSGDPEIWVCDRDASNPVQLSSFGGPQVGSASWSPDSRRIVFEVRASGNAELYIANLEGGPPKQLVTGTANAANPFWSADGRWIYFNTERPDVIWKVPVNSGPAVRLTGEGRFVPQESSDGSRIFFYRAVGAQHQVWSASVDGDDERPVIGMPADAGWTLARAGIYFIDGPPPNSALHYFDSATSHVRKIADLPSLPMLGKPEISSDGRTFLFSAIEQPEADIVLVDGFR